jgi:hypothetical protein
MDYYVINSVQSAFKLPVTTATTLFLTAEQLGACQQAESSQCLSVRCMDTIIVWWRRWCLCCDRLRLSQGIQLSTTKTS